jgi:hypothetical protein
LVLAGSGALVAVSAAGVAAFGRTPDPLRWSYPVVRRAAAVVEHQAGHGPYAIGAAMWPPVPLTVGQGLIERLDADGFHVGANNGFEHNLGARHRLPSDVPDLLITGDPNGGQAAAPPLAARALVVDPVPFPEDGRQVVVRVSLREHQ